MNRDPRGYLSKLRTHLRAGMHLDPGLAVDGFPGFQVCLGVWVPASFWAGNWSS